jgi:peroxiredoxin
MVALQTPVVELGWKALDFKLPGIDGKRYGLDDAKGPKGLILMFICNHCPYVRAIIDKLVLDLKELKTLGIGAMAINANDAKEYPEDSFANMQIFSQKHNFHFPYLYDETQVTAKAYGAVCTPDFFGFNKNMELQYRGRFDSSQKNTNVEAKHELLVAMREIAEQGYFKGEQAPSIGCSIKWKA